MIAGMVRRLLERIPTSLFEAMGLAIVAVCLFAIAAQLWQELAQPGPSGLSRVHVGGFLVSFVFWTMYGLRFKRPAVWVGNSIAVVLQSALLVAVVAKG